MDIVAMKNDIALWYFEKGDAIEIFDCETKKFEKISRAYRTGFFWVWNEGTWGWYGTNKKKAIEKFEKNF